MTQAHERVAPPDRKNVVKDIESLEIDVCGEIKKFRPNPDGVVTIHLSDGEDCVIHVEKNHDGPDRGEIDWLYIMRYRDPDGNFGPRQHVWGGIRQMQSALSKLLGLFQEKGVTVLA